MSQTREELLAVLGPPMSIELGKSEDPDRPIVMRYRCSCVWEMGYGGTYYRARTCGIDHFSS
ncbi:MAG TPA: hypothetical protein VHR97_08605 [Candidatus Baltobacteraceae bacterium]|jgi:hypothetical protein|nr:hypothetical protein [Candidatus Baltobacteraceae bacterium]